MSGDHLTESDVAELVDLTPEQWARIGPLVRDVLAQQRRFDGVDSRLERIEGLLSKLTEAAKQLATEDRDVTAALGKLTVALAHLQREMQEHRHAQDRQAAAAEAQAEALITARESSETRWKDTLSVGSKVSLGLASLAVIIREVWTAIQGQAGGP